MIAVHADCRNAWGDSLLRAVPQPVQRLPEARAVCRQAERLAGTWQQDEQHAARASAAWLTTVLGQLALVHGWPAPRRPAVDPRVAKALDRLRQELAVPPALPRLAASVGLSPARLRALCVRDCGRSPQRLLQELRLEQAQRLLHGTQRIAAIAAACGYASSQHFAQDFKRHTGTTPSAWRQSQADLP